MLTLREAFLSIFGLLAARPARPTAKRPSSGARDSPVQTQANHDIEDEKAFLASINHLPDAIQHEKLAQRERYRQMVQRQGIIEAEHQADAYWHNLT